jgi:hypothetical protein
MKAILLDSTPVPTGTTSSVQDEWGVFDPRQAGMEAVMRVLDDPRPAPTPAPAFDMDIDAAVARPPAAKHNVEEEPVAMREPSTQTTPAKAPIGALYTLEAPARCPQCQNEITTLRVLRVLRTQVSFTSTLPRKGYVIVCPECERLLSAELSGLV